MIGVVAGKERVVGMDLVVVVEGVGKVVSELGEEACLEEGGGSGFGTGFALGFVRSSAQSWEGPRGLVLLE